MSLKDLQTKVGLSPTGVFDVKTLKTAADYLKLSKVRAAHFFGQTSHESGGFTVFSENLNYSAEALVKVFPKYFDATSAASYARNPEKIANKVYGGRMGNGPEASGDGWKYRGRGALQITGKDNYTALSKHLIRPDILTKPEILAGELAFESAVWFFDKNQLWSLCDKDIDIATITSVTKKINGGTIGLDDRVSKTNLYYSWM
jgi:putative chitinase